MAARARYHDRPRRGVEPWHPAVHHRQHPVRCVRPAYRLDDVHDAEPVSRRSGGQAEVPIWARCPERHLRHLVGRAAGAAEYPGPVPSRTSPPSWSTIRDSFPRSRSPSTSFRASRSARPSTAIQMPSTQLGKPASLATSFQGNAQAFQSSLSSTPILIARGAGRHLPHPRHALREHDPSDHHPLDPALGRHRRAC